MWNFTFESECQKVWFQRFLVFSREGMLLYFMAVAVLICVPIKTLLQLWWHFQLLVQALRLQIPGMVSLMPSLPSCSPGWIMNRSTIPNLDENTSCCLSPRICRFNAENDLVSWIGIWHHSGLANLNICSSAFMFCLRDDSQKLGIRREWSLKSLSNTIFLF